MPMIDVYARTRTFADKSKLIRDLTAAMMKWEQVPPIALFQDNTAAFVHDLDANSIGNSLGRSDYVRVQVVTPVGVLNRDKQLGVVKDFTQIVADAAGDASLTARTWVIITEAPDGGWGIGGHAYLSSEIAETAKRILTGGK
jgi:phenylpyruvate tautomerase PptA (4-oxalocrotonate tautomerase family)